MTFLAAWLIRCNEILIIDKSLIGVLIKRALLKKGCKGPLEASAMELQLIFEIISHTV